MPYPQDSTQTYRCQGPRTSVKASAKPRPHVPASWFRTLSYSRQQQKRRKRTRRSASPSSDASQSYRESPRTWETVKSSTLVKIVTFPTCRTTWEQVNLATRNCEFSSRNNNFTSNMRELNGEPKRALAVSEQEDGR